jgi:pantoate--beta-alanine ligase
MASGQRDGAARTYSQTFSSAQMQVFGDIQPCRAAIEEAKRQGKLVGLVPTMGALHAGHLSLIRAARRQCDRVAATIFVNPTQFGPNEDFQAYPRPMDADLEACRREQVDWVFTPSVECMYPADSKTSVHVRDLTSGLCGPFRPGHFDGVATVVAKLFNILPADAAFFGEKDYQQLQVIKRMAADLNFPIEIVACPTVREPDGLAMSSRNAYLSPKQREQAANLSRALFTAAEAVRRGETNVAKLQSMMRDLIQSAGPNQIDYIEIVHPQSLARLTRVEGPARICLAVRIGACRLIDNVPVEPTRLTG